MTFAAKIVLCLSLLIGSDQTVRTLRHQSGLQLKTVRMLIRLLQKAGLVQPCGFAEPTRENLSGQRAVIWRWRGRA
jgi:hypothetical protein